MLKVRKVYLSGFSLIEISIALLILGIISSVSITQLNLFNKAFTAQKTYSNIDFVVKAVAAYCIANDLQLPFPSHLSINIGVQNEGMKNSFGIIPFKSLGIMEKFAKSGSGQWLLYKMNPYFGKTAPSEQYTDLGVHDFSSAIYDDKVAFVIKSQSCSKAAEVTIWYGEKSFLANFTNHSTRSKANDTMTELPTESF
ncbi:MAG: prepilin-type N-terminal cleavage/methylation domain-containing protein [Holosporales bacterium]|jgi:prepilin-type N-terminal cleavage/methylation domain-containing protein|nr:prepilin-type N-terminal cleavage/methylation domain-containing protein [Holosporales bacterium]